MRHPCKQLLVSLSAIFLMLPAAAQDRPAIGDPPTPNAATQDGSGWHYTYLMQKQSGDTFTLDFSLTLPKCAQMTGTPPSGFTAPNAQSLTIKQPFINDIPLAVDYHC